MALRRDEKDLLVKSKLNDSFEGVQKTEKKEASSEKRKKRIISYYSEAEMNFIEKEASKRGIPLAILQREALFKRLREPS